MPDFPREESLAEPISIEEVRAKLLSLLRPGSAPGDRDRPRQLIEQLGSERPTNLGHDSALLAGVWELRWSSSALPYLAVGPWIENLQLLDPERGRGMNLLRLAGPLGPAAGIAVQAAIAIEPPPGSGPSQRVSVRFERGGWLGPRFGASRLQLLREVKQSFPAWLDITVLDGELRVCRGNAGTLFALLRRDDLRLEDWLGG
ncbi:MAG: PAP/fibrillin family protein [Cyanobium sp.]